MFCQVRGQGGMFARDLAVAKGGPLPLLEDLVKLTHYASVPEAVALHAHASHLQVLLLLFDRRLLIGSPKQKKLCQTPSS